MFDGVFGVVDTRVVGSRHLKLRLRAASGEVADAIAFRYLDGRRCAGDPGAMTALQAVYRTAVDEYTGTRKLQLVTEWLVPARGTLSASTSGRVAASARGRNC